MSTDNGELTRIHCDGNGPKGRP